MRTRRYWTKVIPIPIASDIDLQLNLRVVRGRTEQFSVILKAKMSGKWHTVKCCDNTKQHGGVPHCHMLKLRGKSYRNIIGGSKDNMGDIAREIIKDIQKNHPTIIDNYKHSK